MAWYDGFQNLGSALTFGLIPSTAKRDELAATNAANQQATKAADVLNQFNAAEAQKSRDFNASQAQLNRDFQERMSNTAWQRGTSDMLKAGINPLLAATSGAASSPSGSAASGGSASGSVATVHKANATAAFQANQGQVFRIFDTVAGLAKTAMLIGARK